MIYYLLNKKNDFIELINSSIKNHKRKVRYIVFDRKRKTSGQISLRVHQPPPGRLTPIEELKRSDINDQKTYLLCLCDCGKWHICRSDAYKKVKSDGGCHSCGCLNEESLAKNIYNKGVQEKRVQKLKEYLKDKGLQVGDKINNWEITSIKIESFTSKTRTRKYVKGVCPYCKQESQWIRADGILGGAVHSCGCAFESIGEQKIRGLLEKNNVFFEQEKTFKTCISPITNRLFRFDFYVNEKYIIEFDGEQHFKLTNWFPSNEDFEKLRYRDKYKNQWCEENNIPLIRIPYTHLKELCIEDLLLETSNFIVKGGDK